jgi:hypothetical protein
MPYEAYIGYLTDNAQAVRQEVKAGEPFVLEVRDTDTFERLVVRAQVADQPDAIEGGEPLWVLDWIENRMESPWTIRVLEEVDEDAAETARSDVTESDKAAAAEEAKRFGGRKYRGAQLPDSMGGEEARKFYENVIGKRQPK